MMSHVPLNLYISLIISNNKEVMLSSFGENGLRQSEMKMNMIRNIIKEVAWRTHKKTWEVVNLFFGMLSDVYLNDNTLRIFTRQELVEYIEEEQEYFKKIYGGL